MSAPWTESDRADSAVCAALLHTAGLWWGTVCVSQLLMFVIAQTEPRAVISTTGLLVWLAVTWLTMRVLLDANLFTRISGSASPWPSGAELDVSLQRVLGVRVKPLAGEARVRGMTSRIEGAVRLYRALVVLSLLHMLGLMSAWVWHLDI